MFVQPLKTASKPAEENLQKPQKSCRNPRKTAEKLQKSNKICKKPRKQHKAWAQGSLSVLLLFLFQAADALPPPPGLWILLFLILIRVRSWGGWIRACGWRERREG